MKAAMICGRTTTMAWIGDGGVDFRHVVCDVGWKGEKKALYRIWEMLGDVDHLILENPRLFSKPDRYINTEATALRLTFGVVFVFEKHLEWRERLRTVDVPKLMAGRNHRERSAVTHLVGSS